MSAKKKPAPKPPLNAIDRAERDYKADRVRLAADRCATLSSIRGMLLRDFPDAHRFRVVIEYDGFPAIDLPLLVTGPPLSACHSEGSDG